MIFFFFSSTSAPEKGKTPGHAQFEESEFEEKVKKKQETPCFVFLQARARGRLRLQNKSNKWAGQGVEGC